MPLLYPNKGGAKHCLSFFSPNARSNSSRNRCTRCEKRLRQVGPRRCEQQGVRPRAVRASRTWRSAARASHPTSVALICTKWFVNGFVLWFVSAFSSSGTSLCRRPRGDPKGNSRPQVVCCQRWGGQAGARRQGAKPNNTSKTRCGAKPAPQHTPRQQQETQQHHLPI